MSLEFNFGFVSKHRGRYADYVDRYTLAARQAQAGGRQAIDEFCSELLGHMSDERNLKTAFDHLRRYGGPSPGPDGGTPLDYDRMSAWSLARNLRDRLRDRTYARGPLRRCQIRKHPSTAATRTIYVANVEDRVVAGAAALVLVPLLDPVIDPQVYSWRGRGTHAALAYAVRQIHDEGRTHCVKQDLRNAFDDVPRERLRDILLRHVPNEEFNRLVIDLAARPARRGILHGCALSPPLLDLYVSHFFHRPWRQDGRRPPLVTYMDDMWVGCKTQDEVKRHYLLLDQCIRDAGMRPKIARDNAITDLTKASATWLGYRLRIVHDQLRIRSAFFATSGPAPTREKHRLLVRKFSRLHERPAGWRSANSVVRGIVSYLAPTLPYENPLRIYKLISEAASEAGFREILSFDDVLEHWTAAHARWMTKLIGADMTQLAGQGKPAL